MPPWQRIYLVACSAVIGYCLAYVLCDFGAWPRLTYFPYERHWGWISGPPGAVPMAYAGTVLWGLGGAAVAGGATWVACSAVRRAVGDRVLGLVGAWALAGFAYAGLYYTWNLWPF